ncbi:hypothetical protein BCR34DRAFT_460186, partial [Clohesyomyces aquaticus]
VKVPLRAGSDGDATHRPTSIRQTLVDPPTLYLEKIGTLWMKDRGEARPGITYMLERLPVGYALYERPRANDPKHLDKWLYGHPNRKTFDSPNRFFPHFKYLMENVGSNVGCPCTVCHAIGGDIPRLGTMAPGSVSLRRRKNGSTGTSTPRSLLDMTDTVPGPGLAQRKGRPKLIGPGLDKSHVDEEGTPDVIRNLISKLKRHGALDEAISEPMSLDWRAEQNLLPDLIKFIKEQPQYKPRTGEIVFFQRELDKGDSGPVVWEAGVVGQTATQDFNDPEPGTIVSNYGIRVEPLPDPSSEDKSLSKNYAYVPLQRTRPFVLWKDILDGTGTDEEEIHHTVKNALTVMSCVSVVGKHRFKGKWPKADIFCHGLYIGSELVAVGDTIRLLPRTEDDAKSTEVLIVTSIRLRLSNLDLASDNDFDEGRPYNTTAYIFGKGFTTNAVASNPDWIVEDAALPAILRTYTHNEAAENGAVHTLSWYPLHSPSHSLQIHFSRFLSRLHEASALSQYLIITTTPPSTSASTAPSVLSLGLTGLLTSRSFSTSHNPHISRNNGSSWFWAESRSEALGLETVNGLEVDKFDRDRDPNMGRKLLKAVDAL